MWAYASATMSYAFAISPVSKGSKRANKGKVNPHPGRQPNWQFHTLNEVAKSFTYKAQNPSSEEGGNPN